MIELRGLAWDHPRGIAGLHAVSPQIEARLGVRLTWDVHSLADFSAADISQTASRYDLVIYDHPFVGDVSQGGHLVDLSEYLDAAFLADLRADTVGHGVELFEYDGGQWGLPLDAAVQVAAFRPDLCAHAGFDADALAGAPLGDVLDKLAREGLRVAISFHGVGATMCFFTFCYQLGAPPFATPGRMVNAETGAAAYDVMRRIRDAGPPEILDWDSIAALEAMATREDLAWCPCVFGFSAYSTDAYGATDGRRPLAFTDGPVPSGGRGPGAIIGGAGIGVSASSAHPDKAAQVVGALMARDIQRDMGLNLAQPGRRSTWQDPEVNRATRDFFRNTLATMEAGYIRPRAPGFVPRQDHSGHVLEQHLRRDSDASTVLADLEAIFAGAV